MSRDTAEQHSLEWVTPGHPLFEALRRSALSAGRESFEAGACFHSLQHAAPARLDFYRARAVNGLGHVIRERLFAVETSSDGHRLCALDALGNMVPCRAPEARPAEASLPEPTPWLNDEALTPFIDEPGVR